VSVFEITDHTADVGIHAHGETLGEVFAQSAVGMFSIICDLQHVRERESRQVEVEAPDREALLVAWLNELIYLFAVEGLLFRRFQVLDVEDTRVRVVCHGERSDRGRHRLNTEVKAATYHMLQVYEDDHWHAQVILDI
jgi:SHS2 domain-containing protein